jgi:cation diffusion facilitator CzcD-associated flavoprotein CzcO
VLNERHNGSGREDMTRRVAIIGSGICGIAMGVKLKTAGVDDFVIYEAADGLGGTWRFNDYPGAAVDIPSELYQFSFMKKHWTRTHAFRDELLSYLADTAEAFGLLDHMHFNAEVQEVRWDEDRQCHRLSFADGSVRSATMVVSCLGFLDDPIIPTWPGLERFEGPAFHTARWDHDVDLTGKRVAIVGVGASCVQVAPAIQPIVDKLLIFQRQPSWIVPKGERSYTPSEMRTLARIGRRQWLRAKMIAQFEWMYISGPVYYDGNRRNRQQERIARQYIKNVFKDRPDLQKAVTPTFPYSGKRRVLTDDFYPTLLKDDVSLVPFPVVEVTEHAVVDGAGVAHEVDVIIFATGFKASSYLSKLSVFGHGGRDIQDVWRDGAFALAGMTVPGFPNFYMLYGPNTNGAGGYSVNNIAENQTGWVLRDVERLGRHGYTSIETRPVVTKWYNKWLQRRLARTAWAKTDNYMKHPVSGKIVTQFAGSISLYTALLRVMRAVGTYGRTAPVRMAPGALASAAVNGAPHAVDQSDHHLGAVKAEL